MVTRQQERLAMRHAAKVRLTITRAIGRFARDLPLGRFRLDGLRDVYDDMYRAGMMSFAAATYEALERSLKKHGPDDDLLSDWDDEVTRFLRLHGAARIDLVTASIDRDVIARVMAEAADEGWGMAKAGRELRKRWKEVSGPRALRIARTEIIAATNRGTMMGAEAIENELGFPLRKKWLSTMDGRVRESHAAADGQERDLKEPFIVGGEPLMQPGDPAGSASSVINCRCAVTFEVAE